MKGLQLTKDISVVPGPFWWNVPKGTLYIPEVGIQIYKCEAKIINPTEIKEVRLYHMDDVRIVAGLDDGLIRNMAELVSKRDPINEELRRLFQKYHSNKYLSSRN